MELALVALFTAIIQSIAQWLKNRSQDTAIAKNEAKIGDLETAVAECQEERRQLQEAVAQRAATDHRQ